MVGFLGCEALCTVRKYYKSAKMVLIIFPHYYFPHYYSCCTAILTPDYAGTSPMLALGCQKVLQRTSVPTQEVGQDVNHTTVGNRDMGEL